MPHSTPQSEHRPPRVMHVITSSRMAGAETFLARLLHRAEAEAAGATAAESSPVRRTPPAIHHCVSSFSPANDEMRAAGVELEALGIGGKANLFAVSRLRKAAERYQADLLHSHLSTASWWCGWLEQFGGPPSIGHVHGFTSALWHRRQTHLLACTAAVKDDLVAHGIPADRITVMYYAVDPNDQQPSRTSANIRAQFGATPETPVVGTFAHLSVKKGYRELVRAAELVTNHIPNAQFWCFGEGPLRGELESYARAAGIGDRFKLFGFRRNVPDLMQACDVMCLPSHREPFGLVYIEAALAGKPVIACYAGGASEIIVTGETGLLIPPPCLNGSANAIGSNVAALADAILSLLDNRQQAATMGRRGRQFALDRFGWPSYLNRLNEVYARVLGRDATEVLPARHAA
jgi:glycosyltransferase involved in cell wall biosynthesis